MCLTSEGVLSMEMNRQHGGSYLEQFDCNCVMGPTRSWSLSYDSTRSYF